MKQTFEVETSHGEVTADDVRKGILCHTGVKYSSVIETTKEFSPKVIEHGIRWPNNQNHLFGRSIQCPECLAEGGYNFDSELRFVKGARDESIVAKCKNCGCVFEPSKQE